MAKVSLMTKNKKKGCMIVGILKKKKTSHYTMSFYL